MKNNSVSTTLTLWSFLSTVSVSMAVPHRFLHNTVLRIRVFIPDPGSKFFSSRIRILSIPDPASASKNLGILTQKNGF
jgi:hypothetical protein